MKSWFMILLFAILSCGMLFAKNDPRTVNAPVWDEANPIPLENLISQKPQHGGIEVSLGNELFIETAANYLLAQQVAGGFPWTAGGGVFANTQGTTARGMLLAYLLTRDVTYLNSAIDNGDWYLVNVTTYPDGDPRFDTHTPNFLEQLSMVSGDPQYAAFVQTYFWNKLASGTYGAANDLDAAEFGALVVTARNSQGIVALSPWDLSATVIAAHIAGETAIRDALMASGVLYGLESTTSANTVYDVLGLAGAIWASGVTGIDLDPTAGRYAAANSTADLVTELLSLTLTSNAGAWLWSSVADPTDVTNGDLQTTAFAIMALNAYNRAAYLDRIAAGAAFIRSLEESTGEFLSYPTAPSGSVGGVEAHGEALTAICTVAPSDTYVDDDWAGSALGDIVGGDKVFGFDGFSTVVGGIDGVSGSTVHLLPGTHSAVSVHIKKPLAMEGADKTTTFVEVGAGNIGIYIDADGVTLKNFTIQNGSQGVRFEMAGGTIDLPEFNTLCFQNFTSRGIEIHNATTVTNMSVLNCLFDNCNTGIRTASSGRIDGLTMSGTTFSNNEVGFYNANDGGTSWVRNVSVSDCKFLNNAFAGFYAEEIQNATIENSEFTGNRYGFYIFKFYDSGNDAANITLRNLVMSLHTFSTPDFSAAIRIYNTYGINGITVEGCYLYDNEKGIRLNDVGLGWSTLHINNNCITNNNLKGIENTSGQAVDATGNWWGEASGPTHASNPGGLGDIVDDNVLFDPWSAVQLPACGGVVLPPYTLLANDDVKLYGMKDSEGDVHANESVEFYSGIGKTLTGNVSAVEYVEIAKKNKIVGDVTAGIEVENKGTVTGTITQGVPVAVVPLPVVGPFTAGVQDVEVPKKGALSLPPGDYREIEVKQQATLTLTSGVYNLKQIEMEQKARLVIDIVNGAPVTINLVEEMELGKEVKVIINNGASADLAINSTYTSTMTFRDKSVVQGTIIAPEARVVLGKKTAFKGAIFADDIEVLKEAYFLAHSSTTPLPKILPGEDEEEGAITALPTVYELSQNYPNPFNPTTTIRFALPEAGAVSLKIYNIRGQLVKTLASGHYEAGYHQVQWNAANEFGDKVASGFYFYSIQAGNFHQVKKMLLIK